MRIEEIVVSHQVIIGHYQYVQRLPAKHSIGRVNMKVELSFHDTPTRQTVEDVVTVIYNQSIAAVHTENGDVNVYPLVGLHRIKEIH